MLFSHMRQTWFPGFKNFTENSETYRFSHKTNIFMNYSWNEMIPYYSWIEILHLSRDYFIILQFKVYLWEISISMVFREYTIIANVCNLWCSGLDKHAMLIVSYRTYRSNVRHLFVALWATQENMSAAWCANNEKFFLNTARHFIVGTYLLTPYNETCLNTHLYLSFMNFLKR